MRPFKVQDRKSLQVQAKEMEKRGYRIAWVDDDSFRAWKGEKQSYVKVAKKKPEEGAA